MPRAGSTPAPGTSKIKSPTTAARYFPHNPSPPASPHEVNPFAKGPLAYFLHFCSTLRGEPKGEEENVTG